MKEQERKFAAYAPGFYETVRLFPDFSLDPPLAELEIRALEQKHGFSLPEDVADLFRISSSLRMRGLSIGANELGLILLPNSEALIIGYFYLYNAADRLLLLPGDPAIHYLEQHNGAITKLAPNARDFFEKTLPKYL